MSEEFITIACVARPQGNRGEVIAELFTDFPERFAERRTVSAVGGSGRRRRLNVEEFRFHKGRVVLKFAGVDTISQAEELTGCEIQIPRSQRAELEPGSIYVDDLIGCELWDLRQAPRFVGKISQVRRGAGEAPLLVVSAARQELLIPLAAEYVRYFDGAARRLEMALPEGMLELDAPLTEEEKSEQRRQK